MRLPARYRVRSNVGLSTVSVHSCDENYIALKENAGVCASGLLDLLLAAVMMGETLAAANRSTVRVGLRMSFVSGKLLRPSWRC